MDALLCVGTAWLAFWLRLDEWVPIDHPQWRPQWAALAAAALALPLFVTSGFYRAIFRYNGTRAMLTVLRAMAVYTVVYAGVFTVVGVAGVPRSVGLIQPMLLLLAVAGSRLSVRFWLGGLYRDRLDRMACPKVLIYGTGETGVRLAAMLAQSSELVVTGFVTEDSSLAGRILEGLPVFAAGAALAGVVAEHGISQILLAMPEVGRARRNAILQQLRQLHVEVRTVPSAADLALGRVSVSELRPLDVDDLLGREPVPPDERLLRTCVDGLDVLVTGAGGSIGSELCRQALQLGARRLVMVEHSEHALYQILAELEWVYPGRTIVPLLGSVLDEAHMTRICAAFCPHTVYHAAAYKHVPMVEHNVVAGVTNNVLGTLVMARAAMAAGARHFVLISTDKAVRPTNVMGASKRLAELVLQALAEQSCATRLSMVRFGNVLNSSGSVVPLFREQIQRGGPVTVTHPEVTRYFMTIPEAVALVLQASAMAHGGEVFVLDMGQPVKIDDLARRMIELSGLTVRDAAHPDGDIEICYTGLRPGEKLYEELLIGDNPQPTVHPRILRAREERLAWSELEQVLQRLQTALGVHDELGVVRILAEAVRGYQPGST
ncbi:MAG: polysaccharide biosynthesis protein [Tepidimonas ignava]|uniref:polysaccharide biosynthesis protein n=1 Tax=Tepidimonas ignava TaxID=114249 RepID=UPI00391B4CC8